MNSSFFDANDDALKLYHSNLTVNDIVVWKSENGPVIQLGLGAAQHRQRPRQRCRRETPRGSP